MNKSDSKLRDFLDVMNRCSPDEFFHPKFQDFCFYLMDAEEDEDSAYFCEKEYTDIFESVLSFFKESDNNLNESAMYFSFGIFCFRAYVLHCLRVAKVVKKGMVKFCDRIESEYFSEEYHLVSKIHELFSYFKREENRDIEKIQVSNSMSRLYFMKSISKIDIMLEDGPSDKEDDGDSDIAEGSTDKYIEKSFNCFMDALLLSCTHFLNFLDTMVLFSEENDKSDVDKQKGE